MTGAYSEEEAAQLPDTGVRNRSMYSEVLLRQDPVADEPKPACPEGDRPGADFTKAPVDADANPETVEAAVRDLWREVRHSSRLSGGEQ